MTEAGTAVLCAYIGSAGLGVSFAVLLVGKRAHDCSAHKDIYGRLFKTGAQVALAGLFLVAIAVYFLPRYNYYPENMVFDQAGNVVGTRNTNAPVPYSEVGVFAVSVVIAGGALLASWGLAWPLTASSFIRRYFSKGNLTHAGQIVCNKRFGNQPELFAKFFWDGFAPAAMLPSDGDPQKVAEVPAQRRRTYRLLARLFPQEREALAHLDGGDR